MLASARCASGRQPLQWRALDSRSGIYCREPLEGGSEGRSLTIDNPTAAHVKSRERRYVRRPSRAQARRNFARRDMKANQLFVAAFVLGASFQAHASAIVFSNLQGNGLMCGCAPGGGPTVGTWPGDPTEQWTPGDAFSVSPANAFTLDRVELAAALISGSVNALHWMSSSIRIETISQMSFWKASGSTISWGLSERIILW